MIRVKTGIKGFDDLVQGGFPKGTTILLSGSPGTGKTIFGLEFLLNGVSKYKEKGIYITFEQRTSDLIKQCRQFGWNLKKYIQSGDLEIMAIPVKTLNKGTILEMRENIMKKKYKRVVIDSLSTLATNAPIYSEITNVSVKDVIGDNVFFSPPVIGDFVVKRFIYTFIEDIRSMSTTTILTSEASSDGMELSRDGISEFLCDGVVVITFESLGGDYSRSLIVRKMRQTKNNEDVHPIEITKKGLKIHKLE